ncbi:MAG: cytochrome c oxidase accessory protein CcoG, partial [Gammaproteobacteria bacterium]|nr:cytochrome c oxidase accessory protein CcoG [Gammaproteobacteria bacterium]
MNDASTGVEVVSLYEKHRKVYPREVSGRFARLRTLAVVVLLGIYYGLPWLQWNGRQAILFDLPARKFHLFGLTLWPQDFLYLSWLLILAALTLFFVTAVAGRVWCGYACPQTVWTEAFLAMERWVEGDRPRRLKLDRNPWTTEWVIRKTVKQVLWISFAAFTGFSFVAYFTPARELGDAVWNLSLGGWEVFWILFYGFATYGNAGFLREQVCLYMCPYARFQSAMFDPDTKIVSYDPGRGEPRGARKRGVDPRAASLGDCVDCTICVQVCPTGIDIREGLQYECIACAACVDACDDVMERVGYAPGLIRYATERELQGGTARAFRPRVLVYGGLLVVLAAGFAVTLFLRQPIGLDIIRDRNALYRVLPGGDVENVYSLRILNK